ncbi:MAG: response regulator [Acidobacteria bacterium]|nr:response regulator [Acidobacteriota bacterium]
MNRRVLAAVQDIFFASKIRGTAEQLNITVEFAASADALFDTAKADVPSLIILDLHAEKLDPFALAARLKADEQLRQVPLVGFYSHVQTEIRERALSAGVDRVMPRSAFTNRLPQILLGEF